MQAWQFILAPGGSEKAEKEMGLRPTPPWNYLKRWLM
jgi:hypothetical protein